MDLLRRAVRVTVAKPQYNFHVHRVDATGPTLPEMRIINVSRSGFFMAGNADLSATQDIAVRIPVDFTGRDIQALCTVSWVRYNREGSSQPQGAGIFLKEFYNGTETIWRELIARCLHELSVADVMDATFEAISAEANVIDAIALLQKSGKKALVVLNQVQAPVGVFAEEDIIKSINGSNINNTKLKSLMGAKAFHSVAATSSLYESFDIFRFTQQRHLPLVEGKKVVGLLSKDSLLPYWAELMEFNLESCRRDFHKGLSVIAHELRTPFAIIETSNQLLMTETISPNDYFKRELPAVIDQSARVASRLIDEILLLTAEGASTEDFKVKKIELNFVLKNAAESFKPIAAKKQVMVLTDLPDIAVVINADQEKIQQVINNLLNNAIKFSPSEKRVQLKLEVRDRVAFISVSDEGPGIPVHEQAKLFREFPNISTVPTGNEKKTGLGLAITKKIVEAHGGKIHATNGAAIGAIFTVEFPLA